MSMKSILALGAIAILIIAVGCSNGGRTTAPGNNVESLNLPNGNDVNRFDGPATVSEAITDNLNNSFVGTYHIESLNCRSLEIDKYTRVELQFQVEPNTPLVNGMVLRVWGSLIQGPGTRCSYSKYLVVNSYKVLSTPIHTGAPNAID
ncbi:MAG TPA: hypothetical protein DEO84_09485 [candidate division Zixibacteria bacterium]|nr:hypothetical protein [candidate division Zixibacteria bacterium]HBZ01535.1 hypothetical protein [candidate division Zixibacteria bacterium]